MRLGVAAAVLIAAAGPAAAQAGPELTAQERRGEALLSRLCADCHAVGPSDAGAVPNAPAFRTLGTRYKIEALEEALAEGLINGHSDMPEFQFTARDVGDAIAYLNAIQSR
jgi:mono/diheme cytochrome c family protein